MVDWKQAFDKIDHNILLQVLKKYSKENLQSLITKNV